MSEISKALEEIREPTPQELAKARRELKQKRGIARLTQLFAGRQWTPADVEAELHFREQEQSLKNRAMRRAEGERGYGSHPLTKRWAIPKGKRK